MHVHIYSCFHDKQTVINQIEKHFSVLKILLANINIHTYSVLVYTHNRMSRIIGAYIELEGERRARKFLIPLNYFMINSLDKDVPKRAGKKVLASSSEILHNKYSSNFFFMLKELIFHNNNYCQSIFKLFFMRNHLILPPQLSKSMLINKRS